MMDPSEINNFENEWKKAFDEASETPPSSVWEGIEAHLDHDGNDRILPLWWRNTKIWYAAASIAALLIVGGGIWFSNRSGNVHPGLSDIRNKTEMAAKEPSANLKKGDGTKDKIIAPTDTKNDTTEPQIASNPNVQDSGEKIANSIATGKVGEESKENNADKIIIDGRKVTVPNGEKYAINKRAKENPQKSEKEEAGQDKLSNESTIAVSPGIVPKSGAAEQGLAPSSFNPQNQKEEKVASQNTTIQVNLLTSVPYRNLDVFMQKRYVFFKAASPSEEKPAESESKKPKEYWAGLGFMPASFNPDVQIKSAPTAFVGQLASRQKSLTGSNKAGASYAVQTQGGVRISKHWSMELGLNYLKGNARYEGGGYVLSSYNNASSNVLQDALFGLAANTAKSPSLVSNNALYIDVNKKVSNDYQYLQLPVQAGFTLNPDKKLSYSVLGGMMANFFLNNELESASGETITTTANDDVYRSMNWAATTGLRFNYTLSSKWKASLTGSYQKSITSGFRTNQSLESHPYLYGVSWGVRYSF